MNIQDVSSLGRSTRLKGIKTGRQHEFLSDFHISSFEMFEEREICYWIDREHWGKGIATDALKQFLSLVTISPLYVRAAKDNIGSRLVLEKCGFAITGEDSGFANARDMEIEEFIFTLR